MGFFCSSTILLATTKSNNTKTKKKHGRWLQDRIVEFLHQKVGCFNDVVVIDNTMKYRNTSKEVFLKKKILA